MIVKVQRPIMSTGRHDEPSILIYAKDREHMEMRQPSSLPPWLQHSLRSEPKQFAHAQWTAGSWQITQPAPEQDW